MAYILDTKNSLGAVIIPNAGSNVVINSGLSVIPPGSNNPQLSIDNAGNIVLGDPTLNNNLTINAGIKFKFVEIGGVATNYNLLDSDYAIKIISNTYNTVTLPTALGSGGKRFVVARGTTTNNALTILPQGGQFIDNDTSIVFSQQNDHLEVMSNNVDTWYII